MDPACSLRAKPAAAKSVPQQKPQSKAGKHGTAVVCTTALHHFPDPQASIDEMARVLEPGGRVVIGDMCRDGITTKIADPLMRRFEKGHVGLQRKRDIEAMLTRAGLRVTSSSHAWILLYALVAAERPADLASVKQ